MKNVFSANSVHRVAEANINFYSTPFVHPKRKMKEHDFIYVLEGEWKIGQKDEIFSLKKDSLLILSADSTHYGVSPCAEATKTMYFHVTSREGDFSADEITVLPENSFCIDSLSDVSRNKNIKHIFSKIVDCKLSNNQRKADLYFELLLCELSELHLYDSDNEIALKIKKLIYSHPEKFFHNTELAQMMNVSVKTAENKFKAMFGTTIHQYILDFKIKEAISCFEMFPEMSIKEISYNLGFYDEYHFSKQFKKIMGVSPNSYKNKKFT